MSIFGTAPGTVSKVMEIPGMSLPAIIKVPGLDPTTLAITSAGFSQDANVQFMHALRQHIYVYSFGERMGSIEIHGVSFYRSCSTGVTSGIKSLFNFYKFNSVSIRSTPLTISLGSEGVQGFLKGIRSTFDDPGQGVVGFMLVLSSMPEMWNT